MTDRELLEKAAKAYGVTLNQWPGEDFLRADHAPLGQHWNPRWNPLTDDGDALRLACANAIDVLQRFVGGRRAVALAPGGVPMEEFVADHSGDVAAATRRAIVRAAAAMAPESDARDPSNQGGCVMDWTDVREDARDWLMLLGGFHPTVHAKNREPPTSAQLCTSCRRPGP